MRKWFNGIARFLVYIISGGKEDRSRESVHQQGDSLISIDAVLYIKGMEGSCLTPGSETWAMSYGACLRSSLVTVDYASARFVRQHGKANLRT